MPWIKQAIWQIYFHDMKQIIAGTHCLDRKWSKSHAISEIYQSFAIHQKDSKLSVWVISCSNLDILIMLFSLTI